MKRYEFTLTEDQDKRLKRRAEKFGFTKKSDYIRFLCIMETNILEKIEEIHKEVCSNVRKSKKKK